MKVVVDGVHVRVGDTTILETADFEAESGRITGIVGPNGSGKSTLLRCLYRALKPTYGNVYIGQDNVWRLTARQAGLRTAVVAQDHDLDNDYSVLEVVTMGRNPHKRVLDRETMSDRLIIGNALARVRMDWAAGRIFATLSGGERQRVLLARALAVQAPVLLLDEPTTHLDPPHQRALVRSLAGRARAGAAVVAELHDLTLALAAVRIVILAAGCVRADGAPQEANVRRTLVEVFDGALHIEPVGSGRWAALQDRLCGHDADMRRKLLLAQREQPLLLAGSPLVAEVREFLLKGEKTLDPHAT